jgi:O-antigen/teichoic acid export membrane protein
MPARCCALRISITEDPFAVKQIASNAGWMLAERIAIVASSTVTQVILARTLGLHSFGQLSAILAASALMIPLAQSGLSGLVVKATVQHPDQEREIFETALWWRLIAAGAAATLGTLIWIASGSQGMDILVFALLAFCQISLALQVIEFRFLGRSRMDALVPARILVNLIFAAAKIGAALEFRSGAAVAALFAVEFAAVGAVHALSSRRTFGDWITPRVHAHWKAWFIVNSPWLVVSAFAEAINQRVDIIMLEKLRGPAEAGIYAAAAKISEAWFAVPYILAAAAFPTLVRARTDGVIKIGHWQKFLDGMFIVTITVAIALQWLSDDLTKTLFGADFSASGSVLAVHAWAGIFVGMRAVLSRWIVAEEFVRLSVWTACAGAVANVLLNAALIPQHGAMGAALATVISYGVAAWASLFASSSARPIALAMTKSVLLPIRFATIGRYWRELRS